jgi:hypothetical protein
MAHDLRETMERINAGHLMSEPMPKIMRGDVGTRRRAGTASCPQRAAIGGSGGPALSRSWGAGPLGSVSPSAAHELRVVGDTREQSGAFVVVVGTDQRGHERNTFQYPVRVGESPWLARSDARSVSPALAPCEDGEVCPGPRIACWIVGRTNGFHCRHVHE